MVYWQSKLKRNKARDKEVSAVLRSKGWKVIRIWEHSLKSEKRVAVIARLKRAVNVSPSVSCGAKLGANMQSHQL